MTYQARKAMIASTMITIAAYLIAAYPTSPEPSGSRTSDECVWWSSEYVIRPSLVGPCIPAARFAQTWSRGWPVSRRLLLAGVRRALDELEDGSLDLLPDRGVGKVVRRDAPQGRPDGLPLQEPVEHTGIHVRRASHRGSVPQIVRHLADGPGDASLARGERGPDVLGRGQGHGGEHGAVPGPEVLGGEGPSGNLLDVVVDLQGPDVLPPLVRRVGEQIRSAVAPGFQPAEHVLHVGVGDRLDPSLPPLGRVVEQDLVARHLDVLLAHRGQPERAVSRRVALRADAEEPQIEQAHGAREHTF